MISRPFASRSQIAKAVAEKGRALLNLLFPPLCLSCEASIKGKVLCEPCSELLTPLTSHERCWSCFHERPCPGCYDSPFARSVGVFPPFGPALSILRNLQTAPYLAKACSGFLVYQLQALSLPLPDLIVSGHLSDKTLASALASLLEIPHVRALAPAGRGAVRLKRGKKLHHKTALLVTKRWGPHCNNWGSALQEALPARLYGMAFCLEK